MHAHKSQCMTSNLFNRLPSTNGSSEKFCVVSKHSLRCHCLFSFWRQPFVFVLKISLVMDLYSRLINFDEEDSTECRSNYVCFDARCRIIIQGGPEKNTERHTSHAQYVDAITIWAYGATSPEKMIPRSPIWGTMAHFVRLRQCRGLNFSLFSFRFERGKLRPRHCLTKCALENKLLNSQNCWYWYNFSQEKLSHTLIPISASS